MFQDVDISDIINGIPSAVVIVDTSSRVALMNDKAEALTGRSNSEAAGLDAAQVLRSSLQPLQKHLAPVLKEGHSVVEDGDILDRNRQLVPSRFSLAPIEDSKGRLIGVMVAIEDITHQVKLEQERASATIFEGITGLSPSMQEVYDQLSVYASSDAPVLIDGETGTGKDFFAEAIHKASRRSGYPFININCRTLPEPLLEAELFGSEDHDKTGVIRLADHGTIFLSAIEEMPLALQAKLLTVLDQGEYFVPNSTKKVAVDVRIIAATSRDLEELTRSGGFSEDLFYRLNVLRMHLPPLRERADDIPLFIERFVAAFSGGDDGPSFDAEAARILKSYAYPGNIRELRNIIEHAVTLSGGGQVRVEALPDYVSRAVRQADAAGGVSGGELTPSAAGRPMKWDEVEKEMIIEALRKSGGRRSEAAKMLGWARSTLYRKLKHHDI
ncbi:MAG: sigma-54-dependent Fis family transcriptional regulator [Gaiellales bacterium]|nr:MAG: sigma-54-dependent Fis family transcriptional regulator [Gaiellales bacterium]